MRAPRVVAIIKGNVFHCSLTDQRLRWLCAQLLWVPRLMGLHLAQVAILGAGQGHLCQAAYPPC